MKNLRLEILQWRARCAQLCKSGVVGVCLLMSLLCFPGCTQKSVQLDQRAEKLGFSADTLSSAQFQHRVYLNNAKDRKGHLHVYLDGDGQPWITNKLVSNDPTPKNPMILEWMALDSSPSIYLGRPCYHGFASDPLCDSDLWTSQRYSRQVVDSLYEVLRDYLDREGFDEVVLIGFSGGGTLAMLLAEQLRETRVVITVAGNLDIDAWAQHHHYTPLDGSLNPAQRVALNADINQYHLVGRKDGNIPFHLVQQVIGSQPNASLLIFDDFDHACCWTSIWARFLQCLNDEKSVEADNHSGCTSSRLISARP